MVWSSASTVTHAPTSRAFSQMVCAFSSAIFSPSRGSAWPSADSFSDTSSGRTAAGRLRRGRRARPADRGRRDGGVGRVGVGDVLAEIVDANQASRITKCRNGIQRIVDGLAGHEAVHHLAGDRQPLGGVAQPVRPAGGQDRRTCATCSKSAHDSHLHVRVAVVGRRDERLLDRAGRRPAQQVQRRAGLVVGARGARPAERLLPDHRAGGLVVDVEVARRVAQPAAAAVQHRGAVVGDHRAGQARTCEPPSTTPRMSLAVVVGVDVHGEDRPEVLGARTPRRSGRRTAARSGGRNSLRCRRIRRRRRW